MSAPRRTKWHPPPPPTPKILQLPRRISLHRRPVPVLSEPHRNLRSLFIEEKGKAEAEMLRSEHDFLQTEGVATLRKLEKTRERKKIDGSDIIEKKMGKLKARSREAADAEEGHNVWEIREIEPPSSAAAANLSKHKQYINVEMLKRKMEGLSKGMLERIEEYGPFFNYSYSDNNNNTNSAASSGYSGKNRRRIGCRQDVAEAANQNQVIKETGPQRDRCCCNCKQIVGRIAEEVKAESEQWTEMQEMLDQVRVEMEDLNSSRDLWQRRALASELNLRALYSQMTEWKQKARQNVTEHQKHASRAASTSLQDGFSEDWRPKRLPNIKCQQVQQRSPDCSATEKAKHVLVCRLNSTKSRFPRRSPLQEIKNYYNDPRQPSLSNLKWRKR